MNIDGVLKQAGTSSRWLRSADGDAVKQFLVSWRESTLRVLSTTESEHEVFRAQGRLEVLNRILGLDNEITQYQDKSRKGVVNPIPK